MVRTVTGASRTGGTRHLHTEDSALEMFHGCSQEVPAFSPANQIPTSVTPTGTTRPLF